MSLTPEQENRRRSREAQERSRESREGKENEPSEELKAAAAMERADYLVREVKNSKTQVQNIVLHMQQVLAAIRALREQLQLDTTKSDHNSVTHDQKRVDDLKRKIAVYKDELLKMKDDLIREQVVVLRAQGAGNDTDLHKKAEMLVGELLREVI